MMIAPAGVKVHLALGYTDMRKGLASTLCLSRRRDVPQQSKARSCVFRLAAILFYLCASLAHMTPVLLQQNGEVTDAVGQAWRFHDLRATAVLIMLSTMVFTSMLAGSRLARNDSRS